MAGSGAPSAAFLLDRVTAGMSDPLLNAGFTRQQVADALEFCDNDRERALGWLKKQKKGGGKLQWSE